MQNTDSEVWRSHEPVWAKQTSDDGNDLELVACSCGATPGEGDDGAYWFGEHITGLGAPDYMQTYWQTWEHVESTGVINRDAVARELHDYSFVMEQVSIVYCELADLSKPNYYAHAILGEINRRQEEHYREHYATQLCERADEVDSAEVRAELHRLAEEWSPGSVEQYREYRARVTELVAG